MEEFKLQFYFNLYKNTSMDSRNDFRAKFHKRHGDFHKLYFFSIRKYLF